MSGTESGASSPSSRSRSDCLAAADALYGAAMIVDDDEAANTLLRLSDQWRAEAQNARPDAWCPECFEAPEPDGPWAAPGDRCADEHVAPWLAAREAESGDPGAGPMSSLGDRIKRDNVVTAPVFTQTPRGEPLGVLVPCPATVKAVLGVREPVTLPCIYLVNHGGYHRYEIAWLDSPRSSASGDQGQGR